MPNGLGGTAELALPSGPYVPVKGAVPVTIGAGALSIKVVFI